VLLKLLGALCWCWAFGVQPSEFVYERKFCWHAYIYIYSLLCHKTFHHYEQMLTSGVPDCSATVQAIKMKCTYIYILVNGTNVISWEQLNCSDPREQLCIFPPHCYLVCPRYMKNKQRHQSVAGKVGAVCAVVWLFLFCAWDSFRTGMTFRCVLNMRHC
jgi:hypothetical protein